MATRRNRETGVLQSADEMRTRSRLMEVAGRLFAEKGFDRTTSKEICAEAQANVAAINYHFGGIDRLYAEVVREACRRVLPKKHLEEMLTKEAPARQVLKYVLGEKMRTLLGGEKSAWAPKVIIQEMAHPTEAVNLLVETELKPTADLMQRVVGDIMRLPPDDASVVRGFLLVISHAPFIYQNRVVVERVRPQMRMTQQWVEAMIEEEYQFCLAGLLAVARHRLRKV
jgi:TetR/AcrR family transcriptional regulator, regulator of cefoperazone and chloramphenicol sensitivity